MKQLLIFLISVIIAFSIDLKPLQIEKIQSEQIEVTVGGEVENPGVYYLEPYTTMNEFYEILEISENADLSSINGNTVLKDHDVIEIPAVTVTQKVSINTGSKEELMTLPGIGETTAQSIISYRDEHGFFQTLEDLMEVKGIGQSKFTKIKDLITL